LQHRGPVGWAIVRDENKRLQRRHLTGVERTLKLRGFPFLIRAVNFSALDAFPQLLLERSKISDRAGPHPAGVADNCSARTPRKRQ
jgi:hypothetical protein